MGWKIVRDNEAENCAKLGVSGVWRESADPIAGLTKKLFEEAAEFAEACDPGELYDLQDVVFELLRRLDPQRELLNAHADKIARRGGFRKAIEWSPVPGDES